MQFDNEIIEAAEHEGKVQRFPFWRIYRKAKSVWIFNGSAIIYAFSIEAGNGRLWESEKYKF